MSWPADEDDRSGSVPGGSTQCSAGSRRADPEVGQPGTKPSAAEVTGGIIDLIRAIDKAPKDPEEARKAREAREKKREERRRRKAE